ncbi:DUF481 domain-containing protein [Luteithermobacter gelatinilyticus]|uniref:DUF481 domain-containing protein n=1 Tax=Luteithermobacter gelatinilyticus TaxID=2582913 RepID=UPI00143D1DE2|nr:DUF481 domain-containing protein [Luteithermobacter gelatinilyticus]|tara:strand:+ start:6014 stop:7027 length:1014 start_codon:yes stop_codon:yes gene_type:complete
MPKLTPQTLLSCFLGGCALLSFPLSLPAGAQTEDQLISEDQRVDPAILEILAQAAARDGGQHFQTVLELAIAANPDKKDALLSAAEALRPHPSSQMTPGEAPPAPEPITVVEERIPEAQYPFFHFKGWDGEADLNLLVSSGNTDQQSFGLGGKMTRDNGRYHSTFKGFFDFNKSSGVKDKQTWGLSYKLDYDFSQRMFLSGFLGYKNDQFGAFRERFTLSMGAGYRVFENDTYQWDVEGGPSILWTKELAGEDFDREVNAFASSNFTWMINERSDLSNESNVYFGNLLVAENKTALKVKINGALSSKFSFDILYDRDAPTDRDTTDLIARAGLLYDF